MTVARHCDVVAVSGLACLDVAVSQHRPARYWALTRRVDRLPLLLALLALLLLIPVVALLSTWQLPVALVLVPVGIAALRLPSRDVWIVSGVAVAVGLILAILNSDPTQWLMVPLIPIICWLPIRYAQGRDEVGLNAFRGFTVLAQLSRQTQTSLDLPAVDGWDTGAIVVGSKDDAFRGDFVVSHQQPAAQAGSDATSTVGIVDVSGHGVHATIRAVELSGAVNALLASVPAAEVLPGADRFVQRHFEVGEFATAVLAQVTPATGRVQLLSAGHPPALLRHSSGTWEEAWAKGPALGVLPRPTFEVYEAALEPGEALVLYSDGLVESRSVDLEEGMSRLTAVLDPYLRAQQALDLASIVDELSPGRRDDMSLLVLRRR